MSDFLSGRYTLKQKSRRKKSELQEWQTQGGFSLVHTMIYQVLGRLKEEQLWGAPLQVISDMVVISWLWKNIILSCCCFWDHILPQKTNIWICIYLIYIHNISKCLVVTLKRLLWRVWLWWNLVVVCRLCFTWAKLHWNAWAAEWFGLSKPSQLEYSPVNLC